LLLLLLALNCLLLTLGLLLLALNDVAAELWGLRCWP
jgi:hypothetical protein